LHGFDTMLQRAKQNGLSHFAYRGNSDYVIIMPQ
jgi:hypothetical protein